VLHPAIVGERIFLKNRHPTQQQNPSVGLLATEEGELTFENIPHQRVPSSAVARLKEHARAADQVLGGADARGEGSREREGEKRLYAVCIHNQE